MTPEPGTDRSSERVETIEVAEREAGMRLDRWFRVHFPEINHGYLQKLLRSGQVRVNAKRVEANERVEAGDKVRVPKAARTPREGSPAAKAAATPSASKADRELIARLTREELDKQIDATVAKEATLLQNFQDTGIKIVDVNLENTAEIISAYDAIWLPKAPVLNELREVGATL